MVNIDDKVIGRHIQAAREKKHLTQEKFAALLDVTTSYVSRIECGRNRINLERLIEISGYLDVAVMDILKGSYSSAVSNAPEAPTNAERERILQLCDTASPKALALMCRLCESVHDTLDC